MITRILAIWFLAVVLLLAPAVALAAQGEPGPPSGKGPGEEESGNNLSYPAVETENAAIGAYWDVAPGVLGLAYSYGCERPETDGTFSYPNTTCLDELGVFLDPFECVATGQPCEGFAAADLQRIYWQKVAENDWSADTVLILPPVRAAYLDWSDNIESNTWSTRSVIRVETQPFADISPTLLSGAQMWHASGHGPAELWGVRATESAVPYVYRSPFAVINTSNARLNITKLEQGAAVCPTPGTGQVGVPPDLDLAWMPDPLDGGMMWVNHDGSGPCKLREEAYTVELNVGGKYTYGYNWMKRRDLPCVDDEGNLYKQAGWYRLTFYTTNGEVFFDPENPVLDTTAPPAFPAAPPALRALEETEDPMYAPVVDYGNNLTYIDICIKPREKGGGGGGGGGRSGPRR